MQVFRFDDFRKFIRSQISEAPHAGRGELLKIARHANLQPSSLSQIMAGTRRLSMEQGERIGNYFELGPVDLRFFLVLIQLDQAGTIHLKKYLHTELAKVLPAS